MAQTSMTDQQQRQLLAIVRLSRRVTLAVGGALIVVGVVIAIGHSLLFSVANESNPSPGNASSTPLADNLGATGIAVCVLGLLFLALEIWFRRLFQPKCLACGTPMRIGAKFCITCGHDVSQL